MKPFYVVLLMGAAAVGGGLVVRYNDHPVEITFSRSEPPAVVAPPIPPTARVGPSSSVPVQSASRSEKPGTDKREAAPVAAGKPSAFGSPDRAAKPERRVVEPPIVARVKIPAEPPAVIPLERSSVPRSPAGPVPATPPATPTVKEEAKAPEPAPQPAPQPSPPSAPPDVNHATLRAGMLISVRINEALSSNLNSKGDVFSGTLDKPLIADGFVIAERGARVRGEVVDSKSAGRASELSVRLREIVASDGQRVHLVSEPWRKSGTDSVAGRGTVYDVALTRDGAAVIRPSTSITFRLDQPVELTEKR